MGGAAGAAGPARLAVWAQILNVLNLAVTHGHLLLPTADHYDRLLYEILRAQPAFGRLEQAARAAPVAVNPTRLQRTHIYSIGRPSC